MMRARAPSSVHEGAIPGRSLACPAGQARVPAAQAHSGEYKQAARSRYTAFTLNKRIFALDRATADVNNLGSNTNQSFSPPPTKQRPRFGGVFAEVIPQKRLEQR